MADNTEDISKHPPASPAKKQLPESRVEKPAKLRASSPAFQPLAGKGRSIAAVGSHLKNAPVFTPQSRQHASGNSNIRASEIQAGLSRMAIDKHSTSGAFTSSADDDLFMKRSQNSNHAAHMQPAGHFFVDESLRRALASEMRAAFLVEDSELPFQVHNYYALSPLEIIDAPFPGISKQQTIKAQSISDGRHYVLSRISDYQSGQKPELGAVEKWQQVQTPNVARVCEAFITHAFGDNSLVVVHEYKPLAASLKSKISDNSVPTSEAFLWSLVLQLTSALNAIHVAGLAVHTLDVSTVFLSPTNRAFIGYCGLVDVLASRANHNVQAVQQKDLHSIGQILLKLLNRSSEHIASAPGQPPVVMPEAGYSAEFRELFRYLNYHMTPVITVEGILHLAGPRMLSELDAAWNETDMLANNLRTEMANGRLVRLMCKINFIAERTDGVVDPEWSETGDRYLIKLFRDYVFHTVDDNGRPVTSMAHVIGNLNRLDAGSMEKLVLMSRDEKSCLVVSYSEIKRCIDDAYQELTTSVRAWK
ncbi:PAB-dependent poly(A)-specific ribonuclease subunit 3 [Coemansia sp. RSA 990]|nr:PAB-dependent poly(A)-specific ribonuclease subunit 3 [Coemansia sp. RSA 1086]KAJ1749128.1 PAB-dependent poly(A)-specific ribonuclease subunit 3 [Coemansia sp. RSA 1821]KAJ1871094.1 PAB-dependent poly(A)-specific ribonuclease subunit 3 [Coemansia sp. RSA 990]KAJ2675186.1 PAB-dependent poly(A)-specific ribonuclease subunit 3 [Coemansia sp. RSA 1085]